MAKHELLNIIDSTASLYIQLCLGRHLLVGKVYEKKYTKKSWMSNFMQKQFLEEFCQKTNFFSPNADLDYYGGLILKLKGLPEMRSLKKLAVIAFTLMDPVMVLEPEAVDLYNTQLRPTEGLLELHGLVEVLTSMSLFCSNNI